MVVFVQHFTVATAKSTLSGKSAYVVFICSTLVEVNCLIDEHEDSNCVKFVTFHVDKKYTDDSKLDSMVSCQHWGLFPLPSSYLKLKWSLFYSLEWKPDPACARVSWRQEEKKMACPIAYDGVPFVFAGRKVLNCHQGFDQNKKKRERTAARRKEAVFPLHYGAVIVNCTVCVS